MIRSSRTSMFLRLMALFAVLSLVLVACGGDDDDGSGSSTDDTTATTAAPEEVSSDTLVLGAEQEPDCADWIASCAGASWGLYTLQEHTIPRVFNYEKVAGTWTEVPSELITEMPVLATEPAQTVTYTINPAAVWSDGEPITSTDFKYTADQIKNGKDIYDPTGYDKIDNVDDTDPKVAVVTFSEPYAGWRSLFGGLYGVLPSHILQGKNRAKEMSNGYDWSGGPWIAKWNKGVEVVLTPNPTFWGEKPKIPKVIFRFIANTSAEFKAFTTGEVKAIYPQPQPDAIELIKEGLGDANSFYTADTGNVEALWLNNKKFPFNSLAVRQAIGYAIDRNVVVERLFGDLGVKEAVNSLNPPILSKYSDTEAWSNYVLDLDKVNSLMTGDGWEKVDDVWEKNGKKASFSIQSTTENQRRELTEQILQQLFKEAGFELTIDNKDAADLFGSILPNGDYQMSLYAQVAVSLDPSNCALFCSEYIPTKANDFSGQNWQRVDIPELDPLLDAVETNLDDSVRISSQKEGDRLMAENQVSLPLDPLPNIVLWSKQIIGDVGDNPVLGPFWNMNTWTYSGG